MRDKPRRFVRPPTPRGGATLRAPTPAAVGVRGTWAFTLIELLVTLSMAAVLLALLLPVLSAARERQRATQCLVNLRQIAIGFTLYAEDPQGSLPADEDDDFWDIALRPYVGASGGQAHRIFLCPSDPGVDPDATADDFELSYAWRSDFDAPAPDAGLSGDPLAAVHPEVALAWDQSPGWHTPTTMHAVRADGSASAWDTGTLYRNLLLPATR